MKTKEELEGLKKELSVLDKKLSELSEDELKEVTGGIFMIRNFGAFLRPPGGANMGSKEQ